ncbi:Uncharacterized protein APZ42_008317 [Daphnia magna]|uniref:Uncharacterized protein n=1 Tax=Daphnia magna TaxID=35525 RepID=A0A164EQN2_9CRUS|nr:Uncharacterized protein APZ42_008317 [Daphnia magna]
MHSGFFGSQTQGPVAVDDHKQYYTSVHRICVDRSKHCCHGQTQIDYQMEEKLEMSRKASGTVLGWVAMADVTYPA